MVSRICETQNKILEAITQIHDIKRIITNIQDISQEQENVINTEPSNDQPQVQLDISESNKTRFPIHENISHSPNNIPEPRTLQDDPENIKIELSTSKHEEERIDEGIGDIELTKSSLKEISEISK